MLSNPVQEIYARDKERRIVISRREEPTFTRKNISVDTSTRCAGFLRNNTRLDSMIVTRPPSERLSRIPIGLGNDLAIGQRHRQSDQTFTAPADHMIGDK